MYGPPCLIEIYFGPEWWMCPGLLVNHLFGFNLIFLSDGSGMRRMFCRICNVASRSYSTLQKNCIRRDNFVTFQLLA
jgi:hypothetical protein